MTLATILSPLCAPDDEPDLLWFIDRGRRRHRLRRFGAYGVASHRDGRAFSLPWPDGEPVPGHESFAASIFSICMKAAAES